MRGDVAPPFDRFYMGGDQDMRGFDIRSISPVCFFPTAITIPLQNPDGTTVPLDPANPRRGTWNVTIPVNQIIFPGGDTSFVTNLEYRVPIVGPVTLAPFVDTGMDFITNDSQLRIADQQVTTLQDHELRLSVPEPRLTRAPDGARFRFSANLKPMSGTNYQPRMSTGLELQVIMPIVNAPFRVYYAYNPLRLDETCSAGLADYAVDVPGRSGGRLHLCQRGCAVQPELPDSRAAQDVPLYGGDHVLVRVAPRERSGFAVATEGGCDQFDLTLTSLGSL